ncbi:MAG: MalY/PatB family protein [Candidatus Electrothrix aestuarii]|uniref:cysteine-S-conjugate beta-lyase n=1 Tax=Candidatus Electrothrix aestuarii TaxID=3062594 RepID=A0AAU8LUM5_9BACT|nr:MalY/PatB family protein [Candidatus Electrothrix aestuarii]
MNNAKVYKGYNLIIFPQEAETLKYDFDRIIEKKGINSVKWEFMEFLTKDIDKDTLPFWIADMDFMCPPPLLEAIKERADKFTLGYSMADDTYHEAVCNWMERRFSWNIHPSDIFISPGVVKGIENLILSLTTAGNGIIIQKPVYYPFSAIIQQTGRTVVNNALINTAGFYEIDFQDLQRKAQDPANKMLLLCSPHNPVGRVWTEQELRQVAEICLENDVILVSDEIHFDLLRKGVTHIPLARLYPEEDRIITCTAPSKTFNTAGLQISNIIIKNKTFQKKWSEIAGMELPSPLALTAVKAAYNEGEEWLEQLLVYLDENFSFLDQYIKEKIPKAKFSIPQGSYLAWIDFSPYGYDDKELDRILIQEAKVLLEAGTIFGPEGAGFQRMNIACPRATLEQGLERISTALHG